MQSIDFIDMTPDYTFVRKAPGILTYALSKPGKQYAVYLDGNGPCSLSLILPEGLYEASWVNPQTGDVKNNTITVHQDIYILQSPEFEQDAALHLLRTN